MRRHLIQEPVLRITIGFEVCSIVLLVRVLKLLFRLEIKLIIVTAEHCVLAHFQDPFSVIARLLITAAIVRTIY